MPCFRDTQTSLFNCQRDGITESDNSSVLENKGLPDITGSPDAIFAHMGWVGFANLKIPQLDPNGTILRVTSADINLSQEITMPDVIDGRIDRTVYQLGPKLVEGSLSLPVILDVDPIANSIAGGCVEKGDLTTGTATSLLANLWCWATARSPHGRLAFPDASLEVRYANHAAFTFDRSLANTFSISVSQSDVVNIDIGIIGRKRNPGTVTPFEPDPVLAPAITNFLSPARVMTWNDATVSGVGACDGLKLFPSAQVREFSFEINNNAERYYSMNGQLFPVDINVGKREITGSLTMMGLADQLRQRAEAQQTKFTRKDEIRFMLFVGNEATSSRDWFAISDEPTGISGGTLDPIFWLKFVGVIFQIEEMSMTNDVFETTVNWLALASDQQNYLATHPGSSCDFPAWQ